MAGRLLVSIHDAGPRFADETARWVERLTALVGRPRLAMLVVPDHWGQAPLAADPAFARALRGWQAMGIEMFLHGLHHRDDSAHDGRAARLKARYATAGEGEFLGLSFAEATRRLRTGRDIVEQALGTPVAGFIAPAWLYGEGAREAIAAEGFAIAEDHLRVWHPPSGRTLARGPVITWASRSAARARSSRLFAAVAPTALAPLPTVRVGVHPGDFTRPELVASIDRTVSHFARRRTAGRYADLLAETTATRPSPALPAGR